MKRKPESADLTRLRKFLPSVYRVLLAVCFGLAVFWFIANLFFEHSSSRNTDQDILVEIDGYPLTAGEFIEACRFHHQGTYEETIPDISMRMMVLSDLIDRVVVEQAVSRLGIYLDGSVLENILAIVMRDDPEMEFDLSAPAETGAAIWTQRVLQNLYRAALMDEVTPPHPPVSEAEILAKYETNRRYFFHEERFRLRRIIVSEQEQAEDLRAKLLKQPWKFGSYADRFSLAKEQEPQGDMGLQTRGSLVTEAADIIPTLKVGELSSIITHSGGYAIYLLDEHHPGDPIPLSEVSSWIREELEAEKRLSFFEDWLRQERSGKEIIVHQELLFSLL